MTDHVLVIREAVTVADGDPVRTYEIECPYAAEGPQAHWGKCAYLDECGCDSAWREFYKAEDAAGREVELVDWIGGASEDLTDPNEPIPAVEAHEECPKNGQDHRAWEGTVTTPTGECSYQGELKNVGTDCIEWAIEWAPGRYPIKLTWDGPEECYIEPIEETTNA